MNGRDGLGTRHDHRALPIGAGDNGLCLACGEKERLAMNWDALIFWTLLIGGLLATVVALILTFVRRAVRASE